MLSEINEINVDALTLSKRFHSDLPDVPGKSAKEMKEFFDYIPKSVIIPKINELINFLKEKDISEKENQEILDSIIDSIRTELTEKVVIPDYDGIENRSDNDSLCLVNQDMSLYKEPNFTNEEHIQSGLFPADEYIAPFLPCDLQTKLEVIEAVQTEQQVRIPLFALVKETFDFTNWIPSGLSEESGIIATIYICNDEECYIEANCNGFQKLWSIEQLLNGEIKLLDWINSLGVNDELFIHFGEAYFYQNYFTNGYISKIITEADLQRAGFCKKVETDEIFKSKADSENVYSKNETYNKTEIDKLLENKANSADCADAVIKELTGQYLEISDACKKLNVQANSVFSVTGKNLFNKNTVISDKWLIEDGSEAASNGYSVSDFIIIQPLETYYAYRRETRRAKFYDKNKNIITDTWDIDNAQGTTIIAPENACYIRFSVKNDFLDKFYFEKATKNSSGVYAGSGYEEHKGGIYNADATEVDFVSPKSYINSVENLNCRYKQDLGKVCDELRQAIINLGGILNV